MGDRVMMRLLHRGHHGLFALSGVPKADQSIVAASTNQFHLLWIVHQVSHWGGSLQFDIGTVRVGEIPDISGFVHTIGHLLETGDSIGNSSLDGSFGMPGDLGYTSFDGVLLVFEEHQGLRAQVLHLMLALLIQEILLEQIDLVILLDALVHVVIQALYGIGEHRVLLNLLPVLSLVLRLGWVVSLRPLSFIKRLIVNKNFTPPSLCDIALSAVDTRSVLT